MPGGTQQNVGEMGFLTSLVAVDQRLLLQHPVIGAFLHLKWMKIRNTFIVSLIFQFLYVLSLTFNIYSGFVVKANTQANATNETNSSTSKSQTFTEWPIELENALWWMTVFWGAATGAKEMFQLYSNAYEYVRDIENYFQIISILGMILTLLPTHPVHKAERDASDWQHHIAAIVIIVAWVNLMLHVGRFPGNFHLRNSRLIFQRINSFIWFLFSSIWSVRTNVYDCRMEYWQTVGGLHESHRWICSRIRSSFSQDRLLFSHALRASYDNRHDDGRNGIQQNVL